MLAESKHPAPRFLGEHAPAKPRWPGAQRTADARQLVERGSGSIPAMPAAVAPIIV